MLLGSIKQYFWYSIRISNTGILIFKVFTFTTLRFIDIKNLMPIVYFKYIFHDANVIIGFKIKYKRRKTFYSLYFKGKVL